MSPPIISVEHLSKRYIIGHQRAKGDGLRHAIEDAARAPWRWVKNLWQSRSANSSLQSSSSGLPTPNSHLPSSHATREEFWALKDVSFEVKQGEVVGIIGRNGAGKSTLLKILSRITEPTSGRVRIKGRVASLLEVGTGFHPELTGRENIFLNGAILGMAKAEIRRKFDEIVAFSEIEKFLDTPVKRYSSGMYVRLAFAVAAHLEPEILIVDEVLAVGDAQFQKKCLGKIQSVAAREGRTVLFVSHNMAAVRGLCHRSLLLENGRLIHDGSTDMVMAKYLISGNHQGEFCWGENPPTAEGLRLHKAYLRDSNGNCAGRLACEERFDIVVEFEAQRKLRDVRVGFVLKTADEIILCGSANIETESTQSIDAGNFRAIAHFSQNPFNTGTYYAQFGLSLPPHSSTAILTDFVLSFKIEDLNGIGAERRSPPGLFRPTINWTQTEIRALSSDD